MKSSQRVLSPFKSSFTSKTNPPSLPRQHSSSRLLHINSSNHISSTIYPCAKHTTSISIQPTSISNRNPNSIFSLYHISHRLFGSRRGKKQREYLEWLEKHREKIRKNNPHLFTSSKYSDDTTQEIDNTNAIPINEAISRTLRLSRITSDETVSFECQLNLDPKKGNEYIRGNIILPNGTGKERKICVFIDENLIEDAMNAGADMIGDDELLNEINNGMHPPFDVCICTPNYLKKLVPLGRQLGPLGLMPNAKMGTLTTNPIDAIKNAKLGQLPIRMIDGTKGKGIIQGAIGKVSFGENKIKENINSFVKQLRDDLKPPGAANKKQYFLKAYLSTTQGRGFQVVVDKKEPWRKIANR